MQVLLSKNDIDVPDIVFLHLNEMHDRRAYVHVTKFKAGVNSNYIVGPLMVTLLVGEKLCRVM